MRWVTALAAGLTLFEVAPLAGQQELGQKASVAMEAARAGGVTLVCRHALTDDADEDESTLDYAAPSTQRRLSSAGEEQATALGHALRSLGIRVNEVISSPMQRAALTAELMFGTFEADSSWHTRGMDFGGPKRERRRQMLATPVRDGNRMIISHILTIYDVIPSIEGQLEEGDCAVVRPGAGGHELVGIMPARALLEAAAASSRSPMES